MDNSTASANQEPIDARQRPPESIRAFYKTYQKSSSTALDYDPKIIDFSRGIGSEREKRIRLVGHIRHGEVKAACAVFGGHGSDQLAMRSLDVPIYECIEVSGETKI